ncbi:ADP-heptose:LPS heptosyltransferase [Puniceicoccus vermicola]|uniref:Glycosyltransferase family 9 protein n=1 Tax=Puniceicoccus vermicola TaxID=388746 RepID=A0A7X1E2Q8_9BACT|nr:glycosyltransferase family 9 protein [Puniceicoccus vermicola]
MRILIIKPSSFGDIVHALLVVDRIRTQIPDVEIDWVARDIFAGMVEASGLARKVLRFERSPGGFLRVCREMRKEIYDVTLDMQGLARSGIMTFFSRSKMKIGRYDAREGSKFFYRVKVPIPPGPPPYHAVEILRQFQRPLGLYDLDPEALSFPNSPKLPEGPPPGSILLFPESRRAEKEWQGFADLAQSLAKRFPDRTIGWLGTGKEPLAEKGDFPETVVDYRGKVPLASLPSVMREAAVVVANDSGPMHLAAAMDRHVIAVFGPTDPKLYGPYPFDKPENVSIRGEQGDLKNVSVEAVEEAVLRLVL